MKTCLDCKVLPPFSIALCPLHAAASDLLAALEELAGLHDMGELDIHYAGSPTLVGNAFAAARAAIARAIIGPSPDRSKRQHEPKPNTDRMAGAGDLTDGALYLIDEMARYALTDPQADGLISAESVRAVIAKARLTVAPASGEPRETAS